MGRHHLLLLRVIIIILLSATNASTTEWHTRMGGRAGGWHCTNGNQAHGRQTMSLIFQGEIS